MRLALFQGHCYYPLGGWDDLTGFYETEELARAAIERRDWTWWQIVDLDKGEIVSSGNYSVASLMTAE